MAKVQAILDESFPEGGHKIDEEVARSWGHVWVARRGEDSRIDDSPVRANHLGVHGVLVTWLVADEIHVLTIAVSASLRRRGAAKALLEHAFAWLKPKGARKVFLEVRRDNDPAIALYRRLGFTVLNTRRAYYADGTDALEMMLEWDESGARLERQDE